MPDDDAEDDSSLFEEGTYLDTVAPSPPASTPNFSEPDTDDEKEDDIQLTPGDIVCIETITVVLTFLFQTIQKTTDLSLKTIHIWKQWLPSHQASNVVGF